MANEKNENKKGDDGLHDEFTIKKDHLYLGIIGLLLIGLVLSISTGGFGFGEKAANTVTNNAAEKSNTGGANNVKGAQDRGETTQIQQVTGGGTLIDSLVDDDVKLGSDDAQVILVEFSDFQCPFCRKFWSESFSSIKSEYIDTGKVQFVYRDYPLESLHPSAQKSAESAECARDQNRWEEMHDKIFEEQAKQGQGTVSFSVQDLKNWASQIDGIDANAFNECLDSNKYAQEVQKDLSDGSAIGIRGTPGFAVGKRGGSAQLISGAQPYANFKQVFEQLLSGQ